MLRKLYLTAEGSPDSGDKFYYDRARELQQQRQYRYSRIEDSNNRTD